METQTQQAAQPVEVKLETKHCAKEGCFKTWRAMIGGKGSPYCSTTCASEDGHKAEPKKQEPWKSLERDQSKHGKGTLRVAPPPLDDIMAPRSKPTPIIVVARDGQATDPEVVARQREEFAAMVTPAPLPEVLPPQPMPEVLPPEPLPPAFPEAKKTEAFARQATPEDKWREYVNRAKSFVKQMNKLRMGVAKLALEACDIQWGGGGHWKNFEGQRTIKHFAEEIGVHHKTLCQWVAVRRDVVDKLPPGLYVEENYAAALRVRNKVKKSTPQKKVEELYETEISRGGDSYILHQFIKRVKTGHYFITEKANYKKLAKDDLEELEQLCAGILKRVRAEIKVKPKGPTPQVGKR